MRTLFEMLESPEIVILFGLALIGLFAEFAFQGSF